MVYNDFKEAETLTQKMKPFLIELGYTLYEINGIINFRKGNEFLRFTHSHEMNLYFIEISENEDDANKNLYEDSDSYDSNEDIEELIPQIKNDIKNFY